MSEANADRDGLPEHSVAMRLTEGAVPEIPSRYADLLPCPFCGSDAQLCDYTDEPEDGRPYKWTVECNDCHGSMGSQHMGRAILSWNNRRWQPNNTDAGHGGRHSESA